MIVYRCRTFCKNVNFFNETGKYFVLQRVTTAVQLTTVGCLLINFLKVSNNASVFHGLCKNNDLYYFIHYYNPKTIFLV
jgi:hypothetical protein